MTDPIMSDEEALMHLNRLVAENRAMQRAGDILARVVEANITLATTQAAITAAQAELVRTQDSITGLTAPAVQAVADAKEQAAKIVADAQAQAAQVTDEAASDAKAATDAAAHKVELAEIEYSALQDEIAKHKDALDAAKQMLLDAETRRKDAEDAIATMREAAKRLG